ncbi:MAG: hypothetical protein HFK07_01945 [Clostridia bacterium]|jgi:hypothetical protein|nr:hypothetical protein [Clostridia bacterium]
MTLKDVMKVAVIKLGLEDDVDLDGGVLAGDTIKRLALAVNNTVTELAVCYFPLYKREKITVKDGRFDYGSLEKRIVKIVALRENGTPRKFKAYPSSLSAEDGEYEIEYSYMPKEQSLDGTLECDFRINKDVVALGAISEYALMVGEYEKGNVYDEKYKEALKNIAVSAKEIRIKRRAWL